ncbi:MAG: AI-2E family transporter [Candidatus Limnocylindrales bacterium]
MTSPDDPSLEPPDATPDVEGSDTGSGTRGLANALRGRTTLQGMLVTAVGVGLLLFLVQWAQPVLAPLLLGLFITALTAPVFGWALGKGAPPAVALLVTVGGVLLVGGVIVLIAFASANQLLDSLDLYTEQVLARYPELTSAIGAIGLTIRLDTLVPTDAIPSILRTTAGIVIDVAGTLGIAVVIAALLLLDGRRLATLIGRGLGGQNPVVREAPGVARAAVTYFGVRVRINAVTAVGLLVLMLVLGVDDALLWGIAAFFLSFVPYLGLTLALIPPALLAFAESGLPAATVLVVGGVILNLIAENILEPAWAGRALSLATWLVFVMFFAAVWLLGPVGMLVSMPITVMIVLLLRGDERSRWIASLLARDTGETPGATA